MNDVHRQAASCCADFYELPIVAAILGESFHPGGATLTRELASAVLVSRDAHVLDVACGNGNSARLIAADCGARVTACDFSLKNLHIARRTGSSATASQRIQFVRCDAAQLPFAAASFDAAICECSLCLFENPGSVLRQIQSMLSPGGRLGISDFFLNKPVPVSLQGMLGTVLCVARARSADGYRKLLEENGFASVRIRQVNWALTEMIQRVRHKLRTLRHIGVLNGNPGEWRDTESLLSDLDRFISDGGAGYLLAVGHRRTDHKKVSRCGRVVSGQAAGARVRCDQA